jgi:HD superfamily phosphohydrolase
MADAQLNETRVADLLGQLQKVYTNRKKPLTVEFDQEKEANIQIVKRLGAKLPPAGFDLSRPIGVGSTATVWVVHHKELDQDRALKVPRPDAKLKDTTKILIDERQRLAAVNHQNVIRIYGSGEVECQIHGQTHALPYFIMEYLPDFDDFDKAILGGWKTLTDAALIAYFRDALTGISVLHSEDIIHCDIKPGNLLIAPSKPAVVTDLGYAKIVRIGDQSLTEVRFTEKYAHPDLIKLVTDRTDPNANIAPVPRKDLRQAFDLYAFGRTMQDVLNQLREAEQKESETSSDRKPILTTYQWTYLSMISKRLLDGRVEHRTGPGLLTDVIAGLGDREMTDIRYSSATEALIDFEKLLRLYDLESNVPELNEHISTYVQIPNGHVPLTSRVRATVEHPALARLGQVSQLGFISSVYPGARHTRLEHVYGTFTHCCSYARALWYDQDNCLFQCIVSKEDIECLLVAALVHDVAQYPMAHDLTEAASEFSHEEFTESILRRLYPGCEHSLAQVVESEWKLGDIDKVLRILKADDNSTLKERILHSVIDGPIDCDKLDYLKRDSIHLGVEFGLGIDDARLLRYLTVVYNSTSAQQENHEIRDVLEFAEIGVHEKALAVASSLGQSRKDMFTQVYWQHTARCMKAMLGYAVRMILIDNKTPTEKDGFWATFFEHVFDPFFYRFPSRDRIASQPKAKSKTKTHDESLEDDFSAATIHEVTSHSVPFPDLGATDDALLQLLYQFAKGTPEREVLNALRSRRLYHRIAVLSGEDPLEIYRQREKDKDREGEQKLHKEIYDQFRNYRLDGDLGKIEKLRQTWESHLVEKLRAKLPASLPASFRPLVDELDKVQPLILVDIPTKSTRRGGRGSDGVRYLTEDSSGVHSGQFGTFVPRFETARVVLDDEQFDKRVGKVRVFAHPEYRDLIVAYLSRSEILSALKP